MFKFSFNSDKDEEETPSTDIEWKNSKEIVLSSLQKNLIDPNKLTMRKMSFGDKEITLISSIDVVQNELKNQSDDIRQAEMRHSDLLPGIYEGGLKIWECTNDLLDYLNKIPNFHWENKNVLDLGCGAGLLGLAALVNGANVTFQDYNSEVLEFLTVPNVKLNVSEDEMLENHRFFSGDWLSFSNKLNQQKSDGIFDIILTSETIYNPVNYDKLHTVFQQLLTKNGVVFIAGKSVYFGVGGTMHSFIEFVKTKNIFNVEVCWTNKDGISREICRLTLLRSNQEMS